jgi:hypothetical protein
LCFSVKKKKKKRTDACKEKDKPTVDKH